MKKISLIIIIALLLVGCTKEIVLEEVTKNPYEKNYANVSASFTGTIDDLLVDKNTNEKTLALVSFFQSGQELIDLSVIDQSEIEIGKTYKFTTDEKMIDMIFDEEELSYLDSPGVYLEVFGLKVIDITEHESNGLSDTQGLVIESY